MEMIRLGWYYATDRGRLCGLWVLSGTLFGAIALLALLAVVLALGGPAS